jgi:hypothetical protein
MSRNISKQFILLEKVLQALAFYKLGKMWSRGLRTKLSKGQMCFPGNPAKAAESC